MKTTFQSKVLAAAMLFASALPATTHAGEAGAKRQKPVWRSDAATALAEAAGKNKPVLLRFTASWCTPCRVMDAAVWSKADVRGALERDYIAVEVDIDQPGSTELARRHRVAAVPTLIVVAPGGKPTKRAGFMSREQTLLFLKPGQK